MSQETIERRFDVTTPAHLTIENVRGSVDVRPDGGEAVTVIAVKHLTTGNPDRTEIRIKQNEDGCVIVKTVLTIDGLALFERKRPCKVDYVVHAPHTCTVKVRGVSSSASVQGLDGEFDVKTVSGRVMLKNLTGRIRAISVSGQISGERLSGPIEVESISGDVCLIESRHPAVTGSTVSGDLMLGTLLGEGPYRFQTVSGDIRLVLPPDTGCTIGFSSISGRFNTSVPIARSQRRGGTWQANLQSGGPEVHFSSTSGDLEVVESAYESALCR